MPIVTPDVPITSARCKEIIAQIVRAYPFCRSELLATTAFGREIRTLVVGKGPRKVLYTAAHHANEWITAYILLKFAEELAAAVAENGTVYGIRAQNIVDAATIYMGPLVTPDGVDLVTGAIAPGSQEYETALALSKNYPSIPFVDGWKANLLGVDLNLQYPAGWLQAREIKFAQGYTSPSPRDYVGTAPASEPESRAMFDFTLSFILALTLSYHTQGQVIYWKYLDYDPPRAYEIAQRFSEASGYLVEETPYASGFAGYKDWFIQSFNRPGYTIEAGLGTNPLPISDFPAIYEDNLGILTLGLTATLG